MSSGDDWIIEALKYDKCRLKAAIHRDSPIRNSYCIKCKKAHPWERVYPTAFNKRIKEKEIKSEK